MIRRFPDRLVYPAGETACSLAFSSSVILFICLQSLPMRLGLLQEAGVKLCTSPQVPASRFPRVLSTIAFLLLGGVGIRIPNAQGHV